MKVLHNLTQYSNTLTPHTVELRMCLFLDLFSISCEYSLFCVEGVQLWLRTFVLPLFLWVGSSEDFSNVALGSVDIGGEKWSFYTKGNFPTARLLWWGKWSSDRQHCWLKSWTHLLFEFLECFYCLISLKQKCLNDIMKAPLEKWLDPLELCIWTPAM